MRPARDQRALGLARCDAHACACNSLWPLLWPYACGDISILAHAHAYAARRRRPLPLSPAASTLDVRVLSMRRPDGVPSTGARHPSPGGSLAALPYGRRRPRLWAFGRRCLGVRRRPGGRRGGHARGQGAEQDGLVDYRQDRSVVHEYPQGFPVRSTPRMPPQRPFCGTCNCPIHPLPSVSRACLSRFCMLMSHAACQPYPTARMVPRALATPLRPWCHRHTDPNPTPTPTPQVH